MSEFGHAPVPLRRPSSHTDPTENNQGWFPFDPPPDPFTNSPIDLRFLNDSFAGAHGFIATRNGQFIQADTRNPIRFWAVNGPPGDAKDRHSIRQVARSLAKRGVNLVRVHTPIFRDNGDPELAKVKRAHLIVEAMKAEGIYTLFSIYFPLWKNTAIGGASYSSFRAKPPANPSSIIPPSPASRSSTRTVH